MAPTEAFLNSSQKHEGSPEHVRSSCDALDTEMTCPLTLDEKEKLRSCSASPANDNMSQFNGRDRSRTTNSFIGNNKTSGTGIPNDGQPGSLNGGFSTSNDAWHSSNIGFPSQGSSFNPTDHGSANSYSQLPAAYDPSAPMLDNIQRHRSNSMMAADSVPLRLVNPGPVWPSEHQLSTAFAYGVRNEDGTVTRLIRVDDLNRFIGYLVPNRQGAEGMIILPPTRVPSPNSRVGHEQYVPRLITNQLPPNQARRPSIGEGRDVTQMHIDSIVAGANPRSPPRREKIYCDKWIHEGVCAFTQMGCKYKHVMPTDKATQVTLGLNHGFPNWFRRAHRDICDGAPGAPALPAPSTSPENSRGRMDDNWRRLAAAGASKTGAGGNVKIRGTAQSNNNGVSLGRGYGPIAPPRGPPTQNSNPLNIPQKNEPTVDIDDEEDQITWTGRGPQR